MLLFKITKVNIIVINSFFNKKHFISIHNFKLDKYYHLLFML